MISLPENARERDHAAIRPTKALRLVVFLTSEGIINLPASVFLGSMRLGRWQSLADAGAHAVWKAGNSTACRTDRLGMTGHDYESFAKNSARTRPRLMHAENGKLPQFIIGTTPTSSGANPFARAIHAIIPLQIKRSQSR